MKYFILTICLFCIGCDKAPRKIELFSDDGTKIKEYYSEGRVAYYGNFIRFKDSNSGRPLIISGNVVVSGVKNVSQD